MTLELPAGYLAVLIALTGLYSLVIGSFLNVVIYRVPLGQSVVKPRSACPNCGYEISASDNIPVLSWLLLRGKCRQCATPISKRYPLVELATGLLGAGVAAYFGASLLLPAFLYLTYISVALFMIDLDHLRLPDKIVLPALIVTPALLALSLIGDSDPAATVIRAALSAALWFGLYAAAFILPILLIGKKGMGLGDVKLAPVLGFALGWLGWGQSVVGLFGGFIIGGVIGAVLIVAGRGGKGKKIPHGPNMLIGFALGLLVGEPLWNAYLDFILLR